MNDETPYTLIYLAFALLLLAVCATFSVMLTSCSYNFTITNSQGHAEDLVDETSTQNPTVNPNISLTPGAL